MKGAPPYPVNSDGAKRYKWFTVNHSLQALNYAKLLATFTGDKRFKSLYRWVRGQVLRVKTSIVDRVNAWRILSAFGLHPRPYWAVSFRERMRMLCQKLLRILLALFKFRGLRRRVVVVQVFKRKTRVDALGAAFFTSSLMSLFGVKWVVDLRFNLPPRRMARLQEEAMARACLMAKRVGYDVRCYRLNPHLCCIIRGDKLYEVVPSWTCMFPCQAVMFQVPPNLPIRPDGGGWDG